MRRPTLPLLVVLATVVLWAALLLELGAGSIGQEDGELGMEFVPDVSIGERLRVTCTLRCHIDFPFNVSKRFKHLMHSPARGFDCALCHHDDPLPSLEHGKLSITGRSCRECHHDVQRFAACEICHLPVIRQPQYDGNIFDHEIHAYQPDSPACIRCHDELVEAKPLRKPFDCLECHHVRRNPPAGCATCHAAALALHSSQGFERFDHGRHAISPHMAEGCYSCHNRIPMTVPTTLDCRGCHHPLQKVDDPAPCRICHEDMERIDGGRRGSFFRHGPHVAQKLACITCHDLDPLRTPTEGLQCGACHHQDRDGCRRCHKDRIYFVRLYGGIPASEELPFLHAVHEEEENCSICHLSGDKIRKGFEIFSCADCHHHSAHPPDCAFCHSGIEEIRAGRLASGYTGPPEVMHGIVACGDCHAFDPSAYKGMEDGRSSCSRCHPDEYVQLLEDARKALFRAWGVQSAQEGRAISSRAVRRGMHNYPLALEELTGTRLTAPGK